MPLVAAPGTAGLRRETCAQSAAEERLRRGRVSVRGEQLINFEKLMRSSLSTLRSAQETPATLNAPPDAIPKLPSSASEILRILAEYARRGEEALSRYNLDAAD